MNFDSSAFVAEPDLIQSLRQRAFPVDCREDRELFHQGDDPTGLFILNSGEATMFLEDANGVPVAMAHMVPGALLGLPALVGDKPYSMTAVAKAGARVGFITRNTFSALMLSDPLLSLMILRVMAAELHSARIAIAGTRNRSHRSRALRRKRTGPSHVTQSVN
jgi:CRP-like cAMP-binding protein